MDVKKVWVSPGFLLPNSELDAVCFEHTNVPRCS